MAGTALLSTFAASSAVGIPQFLEARRASKRIESQQRHANEIASASAAVENARRRRRAIAQARIAQAQNVVNQSQAVQSSSALSGVQSSLTTTLGSNIAAQNQQINTQQGIINARQRAADIARSSQENIDLFNAVGSTTVAAGKFLAGGGSFGGTATTGGTQPLFNNTAFVKNY